MSNLLIGYKKASGRVQRRLSHKINQENIWRSRLVLLTEGRDNWGRARWPPAVVSTFFGNLLEIVVVPHVEGGPAHGSGDGIRLSLGSLATQTILWFCDAMSADATKRLKKKTNFIFSVLLLHSGTWSSLSTWKGFLTILHWNSDFSPSSHLSPSFVLSVPNYPLPDLAELLPFFFFPWISVF